MIRNLSILRHVLWDWRHKEAMKISLCMRHVAETVPVTIVMRVGVRVGVGVRGGVGWVGGGGGGRSRRDLMELIAWPLKLETKQPSIVLNPCFYFVFISERKLTSTIVSTILTHNILVYAVHQFGDSEAPSQSGDIVVNSSFSASNVASQME